MMDGAIKITICHDDVRLQQLDKRGTSTSATGRDWQHGMEATFA